MSNRRKLKKTIECICDALFADCIAIAMYDGKSNKDNTDSVLASVITIRENYVRRISHPGMPAKVYFKDLVEKFKVEALGVIEQIESMVES